MQGILLRRVKEAEWSLDAEGHVLLVDPTRREPTRLAPWTRAVLGSDTVSRVEDVVAAARRGPAPPSERDVRRFLLALEKVGLARIELPAPGLIAGRYRALRELGRGGAGVAHLVLDEASGERLVAKVAWDFLHPIAEAEAALRHEASILARLDHPGIVAGRGLVEDGGRVALLRAFVEGEPLARDRPGLAGEIGGILAHVHARGLALVDVKPSNFLVSDRVTLIDVGHAREAGRAVGRGRGTPGFVAPEVAAGAAADVRSDLWSWGRLTEAVGGRAPAALLESDPAKRPASVDEALRLSGWP